MDYHSVVFDNRYCYFVFFVESDMAVMGFIVGALYFVVSCLIGRLSCIALYAFGELVHRTTEIERHFVGAVDQK